MKIIDNYRKLPIGKYNEIVKLCETEMDEVDRKVRIVGILTGLTDDEVLALPLTDFTECCAKAKFIDLPCPETLIPSVSKSYPVGGFNLVPVTDMRKVTTAQYIDFLAFSKDNSYFDDRNDIRFSKLVYNVDQTTPVSLKYYERSNPTVSAENKLIPIMRISELYFIMAEYLASQGDMAGAADCINEVRLARSCTNMIPADLTEADFNNALDMEIKRENIAEGQYFFYCKKIDAATINNNGVFVNMSGKYTMNIPDSETSLN